MPAGREVFFSSNWEIFPQIRGSQILEAARLHRLGFPESVPLNEFVRRFGLLNDTAMAKENNSVESILSFNEIDSTTYRIGPSQVSRAKLIFFLIDRAVIGLVSRRLFCDESCKMYLNASQVSISAYPSRVWVSRVASKENRRRLNASNEQLNLCGAGKEKRNERREEKIL